MKKICEFMKAYALIKPLPRSKQHSVKQMNIIFCIFASFLLYGVSVRFPYTCCAFIIFCFPLTFLNKIMFFFVYSSTQSFPTAFNLQSQFIQRLLFISDIVLWGDLLS